VVTLNDSTSPGHQRPSRPTGDEEAVLKRVRVFVAIVLLLTFMDASFEATVSGEQGVVADAVSADASIVHAGFGGPAQGPLPEPVDEMIAAVEGTVEVVVGEDARPIADSPVAVGLVVSDRAEARPPVVVPGVPASSPSTEVETSTTPVSIEPDPVPSATEPTESSVEEGATSAPDELLDVDRSDADAAVSTTSTTTTGSRTATSATSVPQSTTTTPSSSLSTPAPTSASLVPEATVVTGSSDDVLDDGLDEGEAVSVAVEVLSEGRAATLGFDKLAFTVDA
jgi:hypothetical protein